MWNQVWWARVAGGEGWGGDEKAAVRKRRWKSGDDKMGTLSSARYNTAVKTLPLSSARRYHNDEAIILAIRILVAVLYESSVFLGII
jgi:hypothetical protein